MNKNIFTFADPPEGENSVDGIWRYTPILESIKPLPHPPPPPGKGFLSVTYTSTWTGIFAGASADTALMVAHGEFPDAIPMFFVATSSFKDVVVAGVSGDLEMDTIGGRPDATSEWRGTWVITGGTGELASLRGQGIWWGPGWQGDPAVPGTIYYSGDIHFDLD